MLSKKIFLKQWRRRGNKKELRCVTYMYQFPTMNEIILYCKSTNKDKKFFKNKIDSRFCSLFVCLFVVELEIELWVFALNYISSHPPFIILL